MRSDELFEASEAVLSLLPPSKEKGRLRRALRDHRMTREGSDICFGCGKKCPSLDLDYDWRSHDPRGSGLLFCERCLGLMNAGEEPPRIKAFIRQETRLRKQRRARPARASPRAPAPPGR